MPTSTKVWKTNWTVLYWAKKTHKLILLRMLACCYCGCCSSHSNDVKCVHFIYAECGIKLTLKNILERRCCCCCCCCVLFFYFWITIVKNCIDTGIDVHLFYLMSVSLFICLFVWLFVFWGAALTATTTKRTHIHTHTCIDNVEKSPEIKWKKRKNDRNTE